MTCLIAPSQEPQRNRLWRLPNTSLASSSALHQPCHRTQIHPKKLSEWFRGAKHLAKESPTTLHTTEAIAKVCGCLQTSVITSNWRCHDDEEVANTSVQWNGGKVELAGRQMILGCRHSRQQVLVSCACKKEIEPGPGEHNFGGVGTLCDLDERFFTDPETTHGDMTYSRDCVTGAHHSDLDQHVGAAVPLQSRHVTSRHVISSRAITSHVKTSLAMSCPTIPCHVISIHVLRSQTVSSHVKYCQDVSWHVTVHLLASCLSTHPTTQAKPCQAIPSHANPCKTLSSHVSCHGMSWNAISRHVTLRHVISCHVISSKNKSVSCPAKTCQLSHVIPHCTLTSHVRSRHVLGAMSCQAM